MAKSDRQYFDLAMTNDEVHALSPAARETRLKALIDESFEIYKQALEEFIYADGKELAATVVLFSGGNDSTTLVHLFREVADYAVHVNTTIGIEQTRMFVRKATAEMGLPLIERSAPRAEDQYRALVLDRGFPGPAHHFKMYQRLKERALHAVRNELITNPRKQRVVFLAGRRRDESRRRMLVPEFERKGSIVWCSPLVHWTTTDLQTYRTLNDVPHNEVTDLIHMSGECLCGAFASPGERNELAFFFPDDFAMILDLEQQIKDRDDIPEPRKRWGWGADPSRRQFRVPKSGPMCSSCAFRIPTGASIPDPQRLISEIQHRTGWSNRDLANVVGSSPAIIRDAENGSVGGDNDRLLQRLLDIHGLVGRVYLLAGRDPHRTGAILSTAPANGRSAVDELAASGDVERAYIAALGVLYPRPAGLIVGDRPRRDGRTAALHE